MKILCIADEELTIFWDSYVPGRLKASGVAFLCS